MTDNQSGKFRHRKSSYSPVSNSALQDSRLSLKAKGLYALIQSYINIPDYDLYKWYLVKICQEGQRAFDSAWKELKDCGYLKQYRIPGSDRGRFEYEYELLDVADSSSPSFVNLTHMRNPSVSNNVEGNKVPRDKNTLERQNDYKTSCIADVDHTLQNVLMVKKQTNEADHTLQNAPYAQSTTCSEQTMHNVGDINKTELNKNKLNKTDFSNNQSISLSDDTDRPTDEIREEFLEQIEIDWIQKTHSQDLSAANTLVDCMVEMVTNPFTVISGVKQSRYYLKKRLEKVSAEDAIGFLDHMCGTETKYIKNIHAYWKSAFINYLGEEDLTLSTL